jgi:hypothetical protein
MSIKTSIKTDRRVLILSIDATVTGRTSVRIRAII